jgi:predicted HAD superfamily phosphohydrolase YqeG
MCKNKVGGVVVLYKPIIEETLSNIQTYLDDLDIEGVAWSMKPITRGLRIIRKKYKVKNEEMCIIGDQIVTDILAGKRFKINTVLVDPLGKKDLKITALNRVIENIIVKRYEKKGIFKRGNYYE